MHTASYDVLCQEMVQQPQVFETNLRLTMTTTQLSGLTLMHVHRDIPVSVDEALDEFARQHLRRMKMIDILHDGNEEPH